MGKQAGFFTMIVLTIVPVLAICVALGGIFLGALKPADEAYEVFSRQDTQNAGVLLADKGGNAILVCLVEEGNTRLISILPSACPKGEESTTFQSVYQKEGISGLKQKIAQSLSCDIAGYLKVDFSRLAPVVDALGGVEIEGKTYVGQELNNYLQNLSSDSTGARAQQDVVLAVGRRFCSAGFWKGQNALRKLLQVTDTDLSISALMKIGKKLIPALEGKGLYRYCLPDQGKWEMPGNAGMSVCIFMRAAG